MLFLRIATLDLSSCWQFSRTSASFSPSKSKAKCAFLEREEVKKSVDSNTWFSHIHELPST